MLVFIDESGCSGFKLTRGSDAVFAIGMVIFEDLDAAIRTRRCLSAIRARSRHGYEFKFSKLNDRLRQTYFAAVADCPFSVRAIVVEKQRVDEALFRASHSDFQGFYIRQLLQRASRRLNAASIRIDGAGERAFERRLKADLRRQLPGGVADLGMVDSKREELMQLADMCVGAVARTFRPHSEGGRWLRMLKPRIEDIWRMR